MIPGIFVQSIDWRGITIEVSYEPDWMQSVSSHLGAPLAHLQVRSVQPERAALPVSETGYRSRFLAAAEVVDLGGPAAYVRGWLDAMSKDEAWLASEDASRQLSFF